MRPGRSGLPGVSRGGEPEGDALPRARARGAGSTSPARPRRTPAGPCPHRRGSEPRCFPRPFEIQEERNRDQRKDKGSQRWLSRAGTGEGGEVGSGEERCDQGRLVGESGRISGSCSPVSSRCYCLQSPPWEMGTMPCGCHCPATSHLLGTCRQSRSYPVLPWFAWRVRACVRSQLPPRVQEKFGRRVTLRLCIVDCLLFQVYFDIPYILPTQRYLNKLSKNRVA